MNFYRLRLLNTILLFIVGVLIGSYLGVEKNYFKNLFNTFDDYKPIYYGNNKKINLDVDYQSIYLDKKKTQKDINYSTNVNSSDYKIFEDLKSSNNPMDDDVDIIDYISEDEKVGISDFLLDPLKYNGKKVFASKIVLLRGERKDNKLIMYFFIKFNEKDYYLTVEVLEPFKYRIEDFKIGYYYNVEFITAGMLDKGNVAVKIESLGEKTEWASGIGAF